MILARLEDKMFEEMSVEDSKQFPLKFMSAIPVGVDLEPVWRKFFAWMLADPEHGVIKHAKADKSKKAIQDVADAFSDSLTKTVPIEKWRELRAAADAARQKHYLVMSEKLIELLKEAA